MQIEEPLFGRWLNFLTSICRFGRLLVDSYACYYAEVPRLMNTSGHGVAWYGVCMSTAIDASRRAEFKRV
jgi:hypothetical protein